MTLGTMIKNREFFFFHFVLPYLLKGINRIEISKEDLFEGLGFIDIEFLLCGLGPGWGIWTDANSGDFTFSTSLSPDEASKQFLEFKSTTTHHKKFDEIVRSQSDHPLEKSLQ